MIPADFPWRAGMLALDGATGSSGRVVVTGLDGGGWMEVSDSPHLWSATDAKPDLTDPATIGALAGAVRDAYREPHMFALPPGALSTLWTVHCNAFRSPLGSRMGVGLHEGEAWLAAWNGRAR